jgi:hypothetical protein
MTGPSDEARAERAGLRQGFQDGAGTSYRSAEAGKNEPVGGKASWPSKTLKDINPRAGILDLFGSPARLKVQERMGARSGGRGTMAIRAGASLNLVGPHLKSTPGQEFWQRLMT